jgi:hypothetical protein
MSDNFHISFKDLLSEPLLRDFMLFITLLVATLTQGWENIILFLFPFCSFTFLLFFRIISTNKWKTMFEENFVLYNPLGSEEVHGNRFQFSTLIQLIFLFWLGAESLYHPQLIDNYLLFFLITYGFFYSFTFFWIFSDLWKYAGIKAYIEETYADKGRIVKKKIISEKEKNEILSFLNLETYRNIFILNFILFLTVNILNILFSVLISMGSMSGLPIQLPGTGISNLGEISVSPFLFALWTIPPLMTILSLKIIYNDINKLNKDNFKKDKLYQLVKNNHFPKNKQVQLLENLKSVNKKFNDLEGNTQYSN